MLRKKNRSKRFYKSVTSLMFLHKKKKRHIKEWNGMECEIAALLLNVT